MTEWLQDFDPRTVLDGIANGTPDLIAVENPDYRYLYFNEAYSNEFEKLWGHRLKPGDSMLERMAAWPEEAEKARQIWHRALSGEVFNIRMEFGPSLAEMRYYDLRFNPVRNSGGDIVGACHIITDVTAEVRAEHHRELLIRELNHRVKNTLSLVQAIARQTFGAGKAGKGQRDVFESRLANLATAHDLLANTHWEYTSLGQVALRTLEASGTDMDRVSLEGPDALVTSGQAVALSMAFHELATNAMKYGALSVLGGTVRIGWNIANGPQRAFTLTWREMDGPAVATPTHKGFGLMMIGSALENELQGTVTLDFALDGLSCTITAPLDAGDASP